MPKNNIGGKRAQINFDNIKVGDTFQYKSKNFKDTIYNFEVTRKNENDYTVQAMSYIRDGKEQKLFGPSNITTLVNDKVDNRTGGVKLSDTIKWKRKE